MSAVARTRALDRQWEPSSPSRRDEGVDVFAPGAFVEVSREEPARVVLEQWVGAHDVLAEEVLANCLGVERSERLVRALTALHLGQVADAFDELVAAVGGVARLAVTLSYEAGGVDVGSPAEEGQEERDLVVRGHRRTRNEGRRRVHVRELLSEF